MSDRINTIQAYKTSDGAIFENYVDACDHQNNINLKSRIRYFADKYGFYTDGKEDLYEVLIENVDELKKILDNE